MDGFFTGFINAIVSMMIIMLAMRMFIEDREAQFNQLFNLIFRFTEPLIKPVKSDKPQWGKRWGDISMLPMVPILMLILFRGILFGLAGMGIIKGVMVSVMQFLDLALLVHAVLILTFTVFYRPGMGPQSALFKVAFRMVRPLFSFLGSVNKFVKEHIGAFSFITIFVVHVLLGIILVMEAGLMSGGIPPIPKLLLGSFIYSAATLLWLAEFFTYTVIAGALMSWVNPDPQNPIVQAIYFLSEPINKPVRKIIPPMSGIDFTPIVTILGLRLIYEAGMRLLLSI